MKRRIWIVLVIVLMVGTASFAQMPTYGVGRPPAADELGGTELGVSPRGMELPPGSGTARQGAPIYVAKCQMCHGREGKGGTFARLVGGRVEQLPFAPTLWDFIHRAMPRRLPDVGLRGPGLTFDEAYSLTAYILFLNNVVKEDDVLDRESLPKVRMPLLSDQLDRAMGAPR